MLAPQQFRRPCGDDGMVIAELMHRVNASDYEAVLQSLEMPYGGTLLEVGMASALHAVPLVARGVRYIGIDHSLDMVRAASMNIPSGTFIYRDVCDGFQLPNCDRAIAVNTLQWWRDPECALRSLRTALIQSCGRIVIGIVAPPRPGQVADNGQRYYTGTQLHDMMHYAGFYPVSVRSLIISGRPYLIACGEVS